MHGTTAAGAAKRRQRVKQDGARRGTGADAPRAGAPRPPPLCDDVLRGALAACRRAVALAALFSVAVNLLLLTLPIYLFQVSDRVLISGSMDTLVMLTVVAVGALLVMAGLDLLRRFVLTRMALGLESRLGGPVFVAALQGSNVADKDIQGLRDLAHLRTFLSGSVMPLMFDAPMAPLYILVVFLIHPQLGLLAGLGALVLLAIALANQVLTAKPLARLGGHGRSAFAQAEGHARNAEVIQAMGMAADCLRLWGRENAEALRAQADANDRNAAITGVSKFLRLCLQIAMLGWGAYLTLQAELTAGMMIAASIIAGRALAPIEGAIEGWRSAVQARHAYGRVTALLAERPAEAARLPLPAPEGRLSVEGLTVLLPGRRRPILNEISFALAPGESLAVIGATGAGKSTLARLIVGALAPTAGCVRLDGTDVRHWSREQFGAHVGYLPQDVELFPATVAANVARLKPDPDPEAIVAAAELACVHALISQLPEGYATAIAADGAPLSGGQRQRVALARAFFGAPRLVVLDEPNANLDGDGEAALSAALGKAGELGITVVTVTQRPAVLRAVDKILLLQDGAIETFGPRDEVMARLMRSQQSAQAAAQAG